MDILVTGGAGFIGQRLVRALAGRGHRIVSIDMQQGRVVPGVTALTGDLTDPATLPGVLDAHPVQAIVHAAGILSQGCEVDPAGSYRVNVEATIRLLDLAGARGVGRVVFTSSGAVYAPEVPSPVTEDGRLEPMTYYGVHKLLCEQWGLFHRRRYGLDFRVARLSALIGPNRAASGSSTMFGSAIIEAGAYGGALVVDVPRETAVPAVYLEDCTDALVRLLELEQVPHAIYNVSSMRVVAGELADVVSRLRPQTRITFRAGDGAPGVTGHWQSLELDSTRAQRELGWRIRYPLEAMVEDFWATTQRAG